MSTLRFEIYGGLCDALELAKTKSSAASFAFFPQSNGFLMLGEYSFKVKDGLATADLRELDDGEISAFFYTDSAMFTLPRLKKTGREISILPPEEEFTLELAERCRALNKRLLNVEREISELKALIESAKLSIGDFTE